MFKASNFINIFILFILILFAIKLDSFSNISTNIDAILPSGEKKELIQEFNKFKATKKVFIAVKGLDKSALKNIIEIEKQLTEINGLSLQKSKENHLLKDYNLKYSIYKNKINYEKLNSINVKKELEELKKQLISSRFSYIFNKNDPLNIFIKDQNIKNISLKNNHLILKDYGYMSIFNIDTSINTIKDYEYIYDLVHQNINNNVKVFSPIFYFVENSRIMKDDINKIILFSTIILFFLYLIILRNIKLLVNSLITLSSSVVFSLIVSSLIFKEISIFVLVFGISISTVAIDYMFHNYVHGYYEKVKKTNRDVFFGMITSVGTFFIISFVSFDLIKQLCYFSIISLLFSYLQFTFLFPRIKFKNKNTIKKINYIPSLSIKPLYVLFFSFLIIGLAITQLRFNSNLESLNIDNKKLKDVENFFNTRLNTQENITVLIKANSIDQLIEYSNKLKNDFKNSYIPLSALVNKQEFIDKAKAFKKLNLLEINKRINQDATNIGFKKDFFLDTYLLKNNYPKYTKEYLDKLGLEIIKVKDSFITYALLPKSKQNEILKYTFVEHLSIKNMFEKSLNSVYNQLLILGTLAFLYIMLMIFISSKQNYLIAFSYMIFPLAMTLSLSFFIEFNILHLFVLFIILSISIDFGIYMSSKNIDKNTNKAIIYSLLSTFAGFGVLIFSKINALFSIGIIATIGILSITFLLLILKRPFYDSKNI